MATYTELADIKAQAGWAGFQNKVRVAAVIKAVAILDEATPSVAEVEWATATLKSPSAGGDSVLWYVIGANDNASMATILAASDSAVQTNVNTAVDAITSGGV